MTELEEQLRKLNQELEQGHQSQEEPVDVQAKGPPTAQEVAKRTRQAKYSGKRPCSPDKPCNEPRCMACNSTVLDSRLQDLTEGQRTWLRGIEELEASQQIPYTTAICAKVGRDKSTASRLLKKLEAGGFITRSHDVAGDFFRTTDKGRLALKAMGPVAQPLHEIEGSDANRRDPHVRYHKVQVEVALLRQPGKDELQAKGWKWDDKMKWDRFSGYSFHGVQLNIRPGSMRLWLPDIETNSVQDAYRRAGEMVRTILHRLKEEYPSLQYGRALMEMNGVRVEAKEVMSEVAFVNDPVAKHLNREGVRLWTPRYTNDRSKGRDEGEWHGPTAVEDAVEWEDHIHDVGDGKYRGLPGALDSLAVAHQRSVELQAEASRYHTDHLKASMQSVQELREVSELLRVISYRKVIEDLQDERDQVREFRMRLEQQTRPAQGPTTPVVAPPPRYMPGPGEFV